MLETFTGLTSLDLTGYWAESAKDFRFLASLTNLISLNLSKSYQLSDESLELICAHLPNLVEISITWCYHVTDKGLLYLAQMTKLKRVFADKLSRVSAFGIQALLEKPVSIIAYDPRIDARSTFQYLQHFGICYRI